MTATYILYARSGREQQVVDDLRLEGIDAWLALVLEGKPDPKRGGRKRCMIWHERPLLPNYVFATLTAPQFYVAQSLKHVSPTLTMVPYSAERDLKRFMDRADTEYQKARRARERGEEAPPAFSEGETLEAIGGPLSGLLARFRRIVEDADGYHVVVDTDIGDGYHVVVDTDIGEVKMNPKDVRRAG